MQIRNFVSHTAVAFLIIGTLAVQGAKLARIDGEIATHSGVLGANRLADDPGDATGRILLELCGSLLPTNETYLLTVARLEKGLPIGKIRTKVTEKKLVSVLRSRAEKLREEAKEENDSALAKLSLLYFRVVEHFLPADNAVLLGIMKLKVEGVEGQLDDLLKAPVAVDETTAPVATTVEGDAGAAEALFRKAKEMEAQGKANQAQSLWKQFLTVEPDGERKIAVSQGWLSISVEEFPLEMQYWRVFWSPDGKRFLYQSHNKWYTVELATGKSTGIEGMGRVTDVSDWSCDGRYISTHVRGDDNYIFVYELLEVGKARATTAIPIASGGAHAFTPDGKSVLFMGGKTDKQVPQYAMGVVNIRTGRAEVLPRFDTPGRNAISKMSWMPDGKGVAFSAFNSRTREDYAIFVGQLKFPAGPIQITPGNEVASWPEVCPDARGVAHALGVENGKRVSRIAPVDGSVPPVMIGRGEAPFWSPDGKRLALLALQADPSQIEIHRLGGIDHRPAEFATKQTGHVLNIAMRNRTDETSSFDLTCELFDPNSFRIDSATMEQSGIRLSSGGVKQLKMDLQDAQKRGSYTVKLTAVTGKEARAVELVDVTIR